jgi:hypothetical protein
MLLAASSDNKVKLAVPMKDINEGADVCVKGISKMPKDKIDIKFFRKITLEKKNSYVYYFDKQLIAKSKCGDTFITIEDAEEISDGAKLW